MRALEVVMLQPGAERARAAPRAWIGHGVRPAPDLRLDEAFRFAIGLRPVRTRARQADVTPRRHRLKPATDIAAAVVGDDARDDHTASGKPADRPAKKSRDGRSRL